MFTKKKKQTSDFFFFLKATNKESTQGKKLTDIHSRWWEDTFISFLFVSFCTF